jgi:predicted phage-related endonuclease
MHTPPEPGPNDAKVLSSLWESKKTQVEIDPQLLELHRMLKAQADAKAKELAEVDNQIRFLLGESEVGTVDGKTAVTWKTQTRKSLDTKRLKAEAPEVAEKFTAEAKTRVLLVK